MTIPELVKGIDKNYNFSNTLKVALFHMANPNPNKRPTCESIMNKFLITDEEITIKLLRNDEKNLKNILNKKLEALNIKRKPSINKKRKSGSM